MGQFFSHLKNGKLEKIGKNPKDKKIASKKGEVMNLNCLDRKIGKVKVIMCILVCKIMKMQRLT